MNSGQEDKKAHEVVIIRQRANGEEAPHHGGVWKIAYADFMTAMMAFFLVMWLINASDKRVVVQVANYFNPLRLTDKSPSQRGVHDMESGEQGKPSAPTKAKENDATPKSESKAAPGKPKFTEQALFSDPYGVLARLAAEAQDDRQASAAKREGSSSPGAEAYRDPFDPTSRREAPTSQPPDAKAEQRPQPRSAVPAAPIGEPKATQDAAAALEAGAATVRGAEYGASRDTAQAPGAAAVQGTESPGAAEGTKAPGAAEGAKAPGASTFQGAEQPGPSDTAQAPGAATAQGPEKTAASEAPKAPSQATQPSVAARAPAQDEAARLEIEIKRTIASALPGTLPNIDVAVTEDGVLISLTDAYDFGMFAVASAEPRPAMVVIMEKIAKILQKHPQRLVIRGHTDGRPYRSGSYDNWRLSTARAHMAYYMLVRGGIDEKRFERVEGHADRSLRIPSDPEAAQNRRIEILLRKAKP